MDFSHRLNRTGFELRHERAVWPSMQLHRIGLAVLAADEAKSEDDAHELVWNAIVAAGDHTRVREALEQAGVNVAAVQSELDLIEERSREARDAAELDAYRRGSAQLDACRKGLA